MLKKYASEVREGLTPDTWWSHETFGSNKEATSDLKAIFGGQAVFETPKPKRLLEGILSLVGDSRAVILDSFAGSGTTAEAAASLNALDGGTRRTILVEVNSTIANTVTSERLRRSEAISGFRYCTLGKPLFDEWGSVNEGVTFSNLSAFVFFSETGSPIPAKATGVTSRLGVFAGRAVDLLWSAESAGAADERAGNVLTLEALERLPLHEGPRVVYAEGCTVGPERLAAAGVTFKHVPYQLGAGA